MIERWHRSLKAALMCDSETPWLKVLPTALLGLRTCIKEDLQASAAEMLYGCTLHLPNGYFADLNSPPRPAEFVSEFRTSMQALRPISPAHHSKPKLFIRKHVHECSHVFVRTDAVKQPLQPPYSGPYQLPQSELLSGAAGALVLNSVSAKDAGNYTCAATNVITGEELRLPQPATQLAARPGETVVLECPGVGSPRPSAVWSSPNVPNIYHNRSRVLAYGLQITDVQPQDQGSYVCRLDNGIAPVLVHMIKLSVLERPRILRGPNSTLTNEGDALTLECDAIGHPQPHIYWLFNGEDASG
ncbi:interference hedgehog-like [Drosophila sulfurigaster albostrigata]|uniref:interference hedgehog-like n=1 Tax=Drosophila sulfurigaster albostrigata TaxID=89887 RepID=UPI002D2190F2|nr:interference hedgehog-like [Drosophila sulfurigaster albostrigata]